VYAPVIQTAYLYQDDWGFFKPGGRSIEFCMDYTIMQGRELSGVFLYIISNLFTSIEFSKTIRLISIIGLSLFAFVIYGILKRCRFRSDHAFLMSTLISLLPSSQIIVSWAVCIPYFFSAAMSSLSALICFDITSKKINKGRMHRVIGIATAIILLVAALTIYQPSAMMYWTIGVIFFLARDDCNFSNQEFRQFVIKYFSVGLISIVLYYLFFIKIIPMYINPQLFVKRGALILSDVASTPKWFITHPLKRAMNLWNLNTTNNIAILFSAIIFIGIIFNVLREMKENNNISVSNNLIKYFLILTMVILSYLPFIVLRSGYSYRFMVALTPALSILFCFALINIVEFFSFIPKFSSKSRKILITILLTILTVVAAFSAHNNVNKFAMLYSNEFKYVKNVLKDYGVVNLLGTSRIYVRRSRYVPVPTEYMQNEFRGQLTIQDEGDWLTQEANSVRGIEQGEIGGGMVRYVVKLALHEIGVKKDIHITHGADYDPVPEDKNVLVIDMLKFQKRYDYLF
jgi:hypothetical protein